MTCAQNCRLQVRTINIASTCSRSFKGSTIGVELFLQQPDIVPNPKEGRKDIKW